MSSVVSSSFSVDNSGTLGLSSRTSSGLPPTAGRTLKNNLLPLSHEFPFSRQGLSLPLSIMVPNLLPIAASSLFMPFRLKMVSSAPRPHGSPALLSYLVVQRPFWIHPLVYKRSEEYMAIEKRKGYSRPDATTRELLASFSAVPIANTKNVCTWSIPSE